MSGFFHNVVPVILKKCFTDILNRSNQYCNLFMRVNKNYEKGKDV